MGDNDDITFNMNNGPLDEEQIEQLLQGRLNPEQAPGPVAEIAKLIQAAKAPGTVAELSQEQSVLASFESVLGQGSVTQIEPERKRRMIAKILTAKVAGVALAATALTGTAVAAYNGDLPSPIQTSISASLSHVGVSVPNPTLSDTSSSKLSTQADLSKGTSLHGNSSENAALGSNNGLTNGKDLGLSSGASAYGLCTAYLQSQSNSSSSTTSTTGATTTTVPSSTTTTSAALTASLVDSTSTSSTTSTTETGSTLSGPVAFQRLQLTASAKGETVAQFCAKVMSEGQNGKNTGATAGSEGKAFGQSQSSQHSQGRSDFSGSTTTTATNSSSNSSQPESSSANSGDTSSTASSSIFSRGNSQSHIDSSGTGFGH